jgi:hypothetical protein
VAVHVMLYTCYLRQGVVYVPTVGKRGAVYTMIEPVAVVPATDTEGVRRAFLDAIARKNVAVLPHVKGTKWPRPVLLKYAGVRSWSAFARGTSLWHIEGNEGAYKIIGNRLHPKGYWVEDRDQKIEFPPGSTTDDVIDRMIAILQEAARTKAG